MSRGVVWVAFGDKALECVRFAKESVEDACPGLDTYTLTTRPRVEIVDDVSLSRWAKLTLLEWSPFESTAYLDADTRVYKSLSPGFEAIESGWDIAIAPSQNQREDDWLWHVDFGDRLLTINSLQFRALQLQAGVMFVARNDRTYEFFSAWREEWSAFHNQDQAALLRALYRVPVKIWLLGRPWNGGSVIGHRFGDLKV
jgi:hypothetical protein